ncbi:uncharacterized protein LOC122260564 [Penaeus japonicus]|uniref:uncharacterized protein LOC122260564 n=1 Tax=Penaeus japonicus TaxID=27405 RepID=UPI001C71177D|nr:uncharacterized protein LOC122260564 [Penaeus japonicus]
MMREASGEASSPGQQTGGGSFVHQGEKDALTPVPISGASALTTKTVGGNMSMPMQIADDNEASSMDLVDSTFSSPKHSSCGSVHSPMPEPTSTIQHKISHIRKMATMVLRYQRDMNSFR